MISHHSAEEYYSGVLEETGNRTSTVFALSIICMYDQDSCMLSSHYFMPDVHHFLAPKISFIKCNLTVRELVAQLTFNNCKLKLKAFQLSAILYSLALTHGCLSFKGTHRSMGSHNFTRHPTEATFMP